jgi:hypothetical protein
MTHAPRVLAAVALVAIAATRAHADDFAEFRIPDNHALRWTGSLLGNSGWRLEAAGGTHGDDSGQGASTASQFNRIDDSERWRSVASVFFTVSSGRTKYDFGAPQYGIADVMEERSVREYVRASWAGQVYPHGGPIHLDAAFDGTNDDSQYWRDEQVGLSGPASRSEWAYLHDVAASLGAGMGRVRNATGIYEARVLESRLAASGALTRPLSATAREQLATLLYARNDIAVAHDRPARRVWGRIAEILRTDGVIADSLQAGDWFRLAEPLLETGRTSLDAALVPVSPLVRERGWSVSALIQEHTRQVIGRVSVPAASPPPPATVTRAVSESDATSAGLVGEYHRPLSLAWQLDAAGSLLGDTRPGQHGFSESAHVAAGWIVADRWLWTSALSQSRTLEQGKHTSADDDAAELDVGSKVDYFVDDRLDATFGFEQRYERALSRTFIGFGPGPHARAGFVTFTLTYRFAGFASIPALEPLPR